MNSNPLNPRFETIGKRNLVGLRMYLSLTDNKTGDLWRKFMPRRNEIQNAVGQELISMQIFPPGYFKGFDPGTKFEKWAATEVSRVSKIPAEMEEFELVGGLYAVFEYKGLDTDTRIFQEIFSTWLPQCDFEIDQRPHFEVLGKKYKKGDPESEEEIWIPIKQKT